jgi:lipopolysaccharide transport system ATP-binding protein
LSTSSEAGIVRYPSFGGSFRQKSFFRKLDAGAMTYALRIENLGKRYQLGLTHTGSIRELVNGAVSRIFRGRRRRANAPAEHNPADDLRRFWALRDVSFDVHEGEILGIIGRNGAGKSTLLKVLSRITTPTTGRVSVFGRVSSLLEVGTGFHPELTGKENVFLNGSILGMTAGEIRRKLDEIVAFAEVEPFINTPVKRYSSGMYVRLAFAVAAHLDPDILIVDEVLAVGDAEFQKKCLGKLGDVSRRGRTVILVSHYMASVRHLCNRAVWLDAGRVKRIGPVVPVTDEYLHAIETAQTHDHIGDLVAALPADPAFRLLEVCVRQGGKKTTTVGNGSPVRIECTYEVLERTSGLRVYFDLCDDESNLLVRSYHDDDADSMPVSVPGRYRAVAEIPGHFLAPRDYHLAVRANIFCIRELIGDGVPIVLQVQQNGRINRAYSSDAVRSKLQPQIPWSMESSPW